MTLPLSQAKVQLGYGDTGMRGLFSTEDIPVHGVILNISASTMINISPRSLSLIVSPPACLRRACQPVDRLADRRQVVAAKLA